jgi:dTMP kinase
MLYSLNRWENLDAISRKLQGSDFLIADRYTPSNLAYGLARGLDSEWLRGLDKGLPEANIVIVLDVPVPASFKRKKANRDLHESNRLLLSRVRRAYLSLARRFHWHIIKGAGDPETVHAKVWKTLRPVR